MTAGYSGKTLIAKLGLKDAMTARFVNAPDHYSQLLGRLPPGVKTLTTSRGSADFIHLFIGDEKELNSRLPKLKKQLDKTGMLWVSWPKKTSKLFRDVTEDAVRDLALELGLVDVKICAVDDDWSALKLVYRLKDR